MSTITFAPHPTFRLAAAIDFLDDFSPVDSEGNDGRLELPFVVEASWQPAVAVLSQAANGELTVDIHGPADVDDAVAQLRQVLGTDLDATAFDEVCAADPVLDGARQRHPDLRPTLFGSVHQALTWAILSQRTSMVAASNAASRLAAAHGSTIRVDDHDVHVFPTPQQLQDVGVLKGVNQSRADRLRDLGRAVINEDLTRRTLLAEDPADASARLQRLNGIGPFSADLALIRGAGTLDYLPVPIGDGRLTELIVERYSASAEDVEGIIERWRPFRSWAAFLLRNDA